MKNVINNLKLEEILLSNWANFLDIRKILAFVMVSVRDSDFLEHIEEELPQKRTELTLSKFTIQKNGFLIWAEFTVPKENGFAIGTCEIYLSNDGELKLKRAVGQVLKQC